MYLNKKSFLLRIVFQVQFFPIIALKFYTIACCIPTPMRWVKRDEYQTAQYYVCIISVVESFIFIDYYRYQIYYYGCNKIKVTSIWPLQCNLLYCLHAVTQTIWVYDSKVSIDKIRYRILSQYHLIFTCSCVVIVQYVITIIIDFPANLLYNNNNNIPNQRFCQVSV